MSEGCLLVSVTVQDEQRESQRKKNLGRSQLKTTEKLERGKFAEKQYLKYSEIDKFSKSEPFNQ